MDKPENGRISRDRDKNLTDDETRMILKMYGDRKAYLTASFNQTINGEKVTLAGKKERWEEIAMQVNTRRVARRSGSKIQGKMKNICSTAKTKYNERRKGINSIDGGPQTKPLSATTVNVIDLMKDDAFFNGILEGCFSMFNPRDGNARVNPLEILTRRNQRNYDVDSKNNANGNIDDELTDTQTGEKRGDEVLTDELSSEGQASSKPIRDEKPGYLKEKKRKHYKTTSDIQVNVLTTEEEIQRLRKAILKLEKIKLNEEIDNARLIKRKLNLEIDLLEKQVVDKLGKSDTTDTSYHYVLLASYTDETIDTTALDV